jgi:hypothetical protein
MHGQVIDGCESNPWHHTQPSPRANHHVDCVKVLGVAAPHVTTSRLLQRAYLPQTLRRNAHDDQGDGTVGPHLASTALCSVRGLPRGRTSVLGEGGGGI